MSLKQNDHYFETIMDARPQNKEPKQYWCRNHPTGYWVEPYKQCRHGYLKNEECEKGNHE